jgi:signal transduction histidine kinase
MAARTVHERDAMAEAVNTAKMATLGALAAGVAHELNTPMGALNSNHDVLKRALARLQRILADEVIEPSELNEVRRIVAALHDVLQVNDLAVSRMVSLVGSLRTFGRPDRAQIDRIDLRDIIESALTLLAHQTRDRISVVRELEPAPPVQCYPQEIGQVIMNLLVNAIQAIEDTGTITVRIRASDGSVLFEVEDTGVGIAEQHLSRIFEPGFTTKGSRVGMGLGLLLARQVVERHRGRISVRSTPGQGSAFSVLLPYSLDSGGTP